MPQKCCRYLNKNLINYFEGHRLTLTADLEDFVLVNQLQMLKTSLKKTVFNQCYLKLDWPA